ncbi:MAG TPA: hemerythrin domain-containing protein, partial [Anaeromyxobacteraceae bacterium]|nr:hemerythrin domain-containing protein [Anaeromyxobacteraceae bacterium]
CSLSVPEEPAEAGERHVMDAIETLMAEHRSIERVLDALVLFSEEVLRAEATDKEELSRFATFIREFADRCHHGKEEAILFEAMVEHGFPRDGGPIAVMLGEHERGRALVARLRARAEQPGPWGQADRQEIADVAREYAELLRGHIHKEDAVLYPLAERHLPPGALREVGEACDRFEAEQIGPGEHERLHALAGELVERHASGLYPPDGHHAHGG